MSQTYFVLLTAVGEAKLANAAALGTTLQITQMAVGDGNGATPIPARTQTALVHEVRRAALNTLKVDPLNASQIIAEQVIPENVGGWWIRELGLYDQAGDLVAVGNCAPTYKPLLSEGSGRTQVIRMVMVVTSTDAVELKIDPSIVLATRAYVDAQDAIHVAAADPHPQYAPKASPVFTGNPKAPTPATNDNSTSLATTAHVKARIDALVNGAGPAFDTLQELAAALGNDANFAATVAAALALKAPLASPALTGNPTAPTPAQFDNDTSLATSEFVQRALGNLARSRGLNGSTALSAADMGSLIIFSGAAGQTLTLPAVATLYPGAAITILNFGGTAVTIAATGPAQIVVGSSITSSVTLKPKESVTLVTPTDSWYAIGGSLLPAFVPSFAATLASNGNQLFPTGVYFQFGLVTNPSAGQVVTFPSAFTSYGRVVVGTNANIGDSVNYKTAGVTLANFTIDKTGSSAGSPSMFWLAGGY